jgi:hypothetical protein
MAISMVRAAMEACSCLPNMDTTTYPFKLSGEEDVRSYWPEVHYWDRCAHLSAGTVNRSPVGQVRRHLPGAVSSVSATTTVAGDAIYSCCVGGWACTVGCGFTARSTFNNNLIENMTAGNPGSHGATGSATKGWTMQVVALKKAQ